MEPHVEKPSPSEREKEGAGESSESTSGPRKPGLLVVDDDPSVRQLLSLGLRHHGFSVWLAADGLEAIQLYRTQGDQIDLILLDVRMPGLDGPQTLSILRQLKPNVRCCFISGETGGYAPEELAALGAECFFKKPFSLAEVAQILWQLLGKSAQGR